MRKAKIVCTIGPASDSPELLGHLIESGMDVARLNFSHGSHESHSRAIKALREAAGRRRAPVAIIQDLQGPRIRIGTIPDGGVDVAAAQKLIAECGGDVPVIAKIERPEAVHSLGGILDQADGVMIARGDLGAQMGPEAVPVLQKKIITEANRRRRLVITATQMLESMTQNPRPTRAEASDVANAVFDGSDAVMLSAETAIGRYPVEAVCVMDRIIRAAEEGIEPRFERRSDVGHGEVSFPEAICGAASWAVAATAGSAIVAFSELGTTARLISKQRPVAPIIAFTPYEPVRRQMALYWGVIPHTMEQIAQTDERVHEAERRLKAEGLVKPGQRIVILSGTRIGEAGGTNLMKLHHVE